MNFNRISCNEECDIEKLGVSFSLFSLKMTRQKLLFENYLDVIIYKSMFYCVIYHIPCKASNGG